MSRQNVEDLYPLSPLQQGLLFHTLYSPETGAYTEQFAMRLRGPLDADALARAMQQVVDRHTVLRTGFVWEKVPQPMQVVFRSVEVPVRRLEWSAVAEAGLSEAVQALLREDRREGFDLRKAPLVRLTLARLGERDHVAVISCHHIVLDGWSLPLVLGDLGALYAAQLGEPVRLPPARPYREYVKWLGAQDPAGAERHWREALRGFAAPTPLPLDAAPGSVMAEEHAMEVLALPPELGERITGFAREHRVTPNTLAQAAWALVLSRYSGEDDVAFGFTTSGRPADLPGVERMVGLFINTLPFRVRVGPRAPVLAWLEEIQRAQAEHRQYEYARLMDIQGWSEVPRDRPLFETLVVYENYPVPSLGDEEAGEDRLGMEMLGGSDRTNYPLTVVIAPGATTEARITYDAARYRPETVRRLLASVRAALEGFVADPAQPVGAISLATDEDQREVAEWNRASERDYPRDLPVHRLFEAQAARTPDAAAVVHAGRTLTYAELDRRADALARRLRALGVGPEVVAGVCCDRTPELVVALLGVLKAGGAYVPLDPSYPADRLAYMLADSGARVLVTRPGVADHVSADGVATVFVDASEEEMDDAPSVAAAAEAGGGSLAHVIYTSGSTGRPKGVQVEHRSVVAFLHSMREVLPLAPGDRVLGSTSVSFDVSVAEVHYALAWGGTLVLVENALSLLDLPRGETLAHAAMAPTAAAELARSGGFGPGRPARIVLAGEALPDALAADLYAAGVGEVCNGYGPTEDTTYSTFQRVPRGGRVTIGRPLGAGRAYVVDARMRTAAVGAPGELCLAGAGVARGYLGRPALTAERFVPDPFAAEPGARMYRTGDLARWLPTGELEYLGRMDDQVKVRGFRVEVGEVEVALAHHPGIRAAAVAARDDAPGGRGLVAYVVPSGGEIPPAAELRAFLAETLPDYMVPAAFVALDAIPLTPSGKTDRRALPAPEGGALSGRAEFVAPRSGTEEKLAGIWSALLRVERVGARDSFFELGGHSLLATQLVSRLREAFEVEVPLRVLFEAPVLAEMAARVEAALGGGECSPIPAPGEGTREGPAPLSFAQERLWLVDRLAPGSAAYNMAEALRLRGALDVPALERAVTEIVRRHESLRTTFAEGPDGAPVQVVAPAEPVAVPVDDLSALPESEREAELARRVDAGAREPFDLARGPVLRLRLFRLGEREHVLLLSMHHVVSDAWSVSVLVRELAALYEAFSAGQASPLPALPLQYADFAAWQRGWLQGEALEAQVRWWAEHLAGAPPALELPTDLPRPAVQSHAGAELSFDLPPALVERLGALAREAGATPFMATLAAFQALLARWSGQDDVVVGTPVAGRTRGEVEGLIGFFVNTLPLRGDVSGDPTFRELLGRVRERALGAFAHQDVPFERLVEELRVERSLARPPVFQAMFALNAVPGGGGFGLKGLEIERVPRDLGTARLDLTLVLTDTGEGLHGVLEYCTDLFLPSTARRLAAHFRALLEAAVAAPDARLSHLPLSAPAERERTLVEWNRTARPYPREATVHELFALQVRRTPDAVAVAWGDERLTYRELNARANRIAWQLRALGVGVDTRVALAVERSAAMVAAVLGVLKAGGAYVPLDAAYPPARLRHMLEKSGAAVLLVDDAVPEALDGFGGRVLSLRRHHGLIGRQPSVDPEPAGGAASLAYVLFTSGSTGLPKGVAVPHRAVVRLVRNTTFADFGPGEVFLQLAPLAFDASTLELWGPLLNGGRLVIAPPGQLGLAERGRLIAESGVTTLWLTAGLFHQMVDAEIESLRGLRQLLAGGDVLSVAHVRRALERLPGVRLINGYGPTESTTFAACHTVRPVDVERGSIPIGRPIANTRVYVLDSADRPCPVGVPGELCIAGDGLARGYVGEPEQTAERFVDVAIDGVGTERVYRTGDRVRWLEDGTLEFLGRLDGQVKLRGFRIEPGEIEAALRAHPGVREAVAIVREDAPGDRRLVAYVVGDGDGSADADGLRAALAGRLPEYMIPAAIVALDALPLTPNGKVDRRALPAPEWSAADAQVEPRTETEARLAALWAEVLGVPKVGVEDDFFRLGGHSLLATQVVSRIRREFGVELPLRALFEAPTVARLAARVDAEQRGVTDTIPILPRDGYLTPSHTQRWLWGMERRRPPSDLFNLPSPLRLRGALDADALGSALREVVRRHEPLRTRFVEVDGEPMMVVGGAEAFELPLIDLTPLPEDEREPAALRLVAGDLERPFELEGGPLFRAALVRVSEVDHLLLLNAHHLVTDGWSVGILISELLTAYDDFRLARPSRLPPLAVGYADWAAWQRGWLGSERVERQLAYWRGKLAGAPPLLALPADSPRPPVQAHRGGRASAVFPRALLDRVHALGAGEGATPYMVLLAAFKLLLGRLAGQDDVVVGTPIAGRTRAEAEPLVGLFLNILALRTDLAGAATFRELVARVRETTLGAYANQDVPFAWLLDALEVERRPDRSPLYQVTFNMANFGGGALDGPEQEPGLEVEMLAPPVDPGAKYDLTYYVQEAPDGLHLHAVYDADLFSAGRMEEMLAQYRRVLEQVTADPDAAPGDVSLAPYAVEVALPEPAAIP